MGKNILGVIVGYVIMALVVLACLSAAYFALGADIAFTEGTYNPSMLWLILMLAVGAVAGVVGGLVCKLITNSTGAIKSLAVVVLVLGGVTAGAALLADKEDPGARTEEVGNFEAMTKAEQPVWTLIANPIVGVFGVLFGAGLVGGRQESASAPSGASGED